MRITVLGCSGSVSGPDSAASGYLLTAPGTPPVVMDFGPGVLGALQKHADPGEATILLSHLHLDHLLGLPTYKGLIAPGTALSCFLCMSVRKAPARNSSSTWMYMG